MINKEIKNKCNEIALNIFDKYNLRDKKRVHSIHVAQIGEFLANLLVQKGCEIDVEKVYLAGLLHDIGDEARNQDWDLDRHTQTGYEILIKEGLVEIANIIKKHDVLAYENDETIPQTWEEKILNYSDKRDKNEIVTLEERKQRFIKLFPNEKERIERCFVKIFENEISLFNKLEIKPDQLKDFIILEDNL